MSLKVESVKLDQLKQFPGNPRKGNVDLIAESLELYGQYKPITVKLDGQILAGNHTYLAAKSLGWTEIDVVYVDVDDETAVKIVAMDNRSQELGDFDNTALLRLLTELPDLEGTGYDSSDLDDLSALLQEAQTPKISGNISVVEVGETGQNGTYQQPTLKDYAERYNQKATRMLIADYPNNVYIWLMEKMIAYREKHSIASNADAVIHLIEQASGEKAPNETI